MIFGIDLFRVHTLGVSGAWTHLSFSFESFHY